MNDPFALSRKWAMKKLVKNINTTLFLMSDPKNVLIRTYNITGRDSPNSVFGIAYMIEHLE